MLLNKNFEPHVRADGGDWAIATRNGQFCLIAARSFRKGELIFQLEGVETARPTYTSVQIGLDLHIDMDPSFGLAEQMQSYPWRFMNHHCDANAAFADRECRAIRDIADEEELTFNYNSTELDMAQPFECGCRSAHCAGKIGGFLHADSGLRLRLEPFLPPYLRVSARETLLPSRD